MRKSITYKITYIAILTALSLLMFMLENLFPPIFPFAPGVRLGLSNVFILYALITLTYLDAFCILSLKCILSSIFSGNIFSFVYSFSGGVVSFIIMLIFVHFLFKRVGVVAISLLGATAHNLVQLLVASIIVSSFAIFNYVPIMLVASSAAGVFCGFVVYFAIKSMPRKYLLIN